MAVDQFRLVPSAPTPFSPSGDTAGVCTGFLVPENKTVPLRHPNKMCFLRVVCGNLCTRLGLGQSVPCPRHSNMVSDWVFTLECRDAPLAPLRAPVTPVRMHELAREKLFLL
jgi:hypothetical protein